MPRLPYEPRYTFADVPAGVDYLAEAELRLGRAHTLHSHAQLQVLWLLEGQLRMILDGREHVLEPGEMCRVAAGQLHAVGQSTQGRSRRARVLDLRLNVAGDGALARYVTTLSGGPVFPADAQQVASAAAHLRRAAQDRAPAALAVVQSLLWRLLAAIRPPPAPPVPARQDRRLELAESFMRARMAHPIGVPDIARAVQLSTSQLTRLYATIDTTPARRLRDLRVEHARQLLRGSTLSIKQVAHACGFVCPNHFSRAYHQSTGARPSTDRR